MSPLAGKSHDIVLTINGEDKGYMLLKQEKGKAWEREPVVALPPSLSAGGANYTNFPPQVDKTWVQDRWRRGMGFHIWEDENPETHAGFSYSEGCYTRKEGYLHLAPKPNRVPRYGGGAVGTGQRFSARFRNTIPITSSSIASPTVITTTTAHGLYTGDTVTITGHTGSTPAVDGEYAITVTGATTFTIPVAVTVAGTGGNARWDGDYFTRGNQLFKLANDGLTAYLVNTFPLTITHLHAYKTWLLVAQGDDANHYYSTDSVAWTVSAVASSQGTLFGTRLGTLWKAEGHALRSTSNPTVSWSAETEVADNTSNIVAIYTQDNRLRVQKTDGLYNINSLGDVEVIYTEFPFDAAVQAGLVHNQMLYFPEAQNVVKHTYNGYLEDAGGGRFGRFSAPVIGRIHQMTEDQFFLYAAFEGLDGNYRVLIHEELPDGTDAWDTLVATGVGECKMVFVSDLYGVNRRLYFGNGADLNYVVLSRYHGDMLADSNCRYVNHGVLYGPRYHLSFAAAQKVFDRWSCTRELLSADTAVGLFYQVDGDGVWIACLEQSGTTQTDFLLGREETGVWIQPRWELWTDDDTETPVIRDTVLHTRVRVTTSQHHAIRFTVEIAGPGETRGARYVENVREQIDRLLALQYQATPIYLQDPIGERHRVSIQRVREVLTSVQAGGDIVYAVAVEALTYDDYVPGVGYNTGKLYNDDEVYARKV